MDNFTPLTSLFGGALIGLSAVVLMLLNGRIAGISGITAGMFSGLGSANDRGWRVAFVVGVVCAPLMVMFATGERPAITFPAPIAVMTIAGLLVGFGTVLGNGCTSGHGVCGMARLSVRSIVATLVFMGAGIATTFVARHLLAGAWVMERTLSGLAAGLLFGAGLAISEMINPAKVLNFLDLAGDWDPSLALVMVGALAVTAVGYKIVLRRSQPLFDSQFNVPTRVDLDPSLILGASLFGIGWGLGGYCPGPALAGLGFGSRETLVFVAAMLLGMVAARLSGKFFNGLTWKPKSAA
jgi:uncharacterized protein